MMPIINILDFAHLSLYVYKDAKIVQNTSADFIQTRQGAIYADEFNPQKLADNGFYEVLLSPHVQNIESLSNPFYASFFVKVVNRKAVGAVIAIRGTVAGIWDNVVTDMSSWKNNALNPKEQVNPPSSYVSQAGFFYFKVFKYCRNQLNLNPFQLFATGHSLGGAIAALLPAYVGCHLRSVTFNAPGIKDIPDIKHRTHNILNFRSQYDFVSAVDYPIGSGFDVVVPQRMEQAKKSFELWRKHAEEQENGKSNWDVWGHAKESVDFTKSVMAQHSMLNLYKAMAMNQGEHCLESCCYDVAWKLIDGWSNSTIYEGPIGRG